MLWQHLVHSITKVMVQNYECLRLIAQPSVAALSYEAEKDIYQKYFPQSSGKETKAKKQKKQKLQVFHYCMKLGHLFSVNISQREIAH